MVSRRPYGEGLPRTLPPLPSSRAREPAARAAPGAGATPRAARRGPPATTATLFFSGFMGRLLRDQARAAGKGTPRRRVGPRPPYPAAGRAVLEKWNLAGRAGTA